MLLRTAVACALIASVAFLAWRDLRTFAPATYGEAPASARALVDELAKRERVAGGDGARDALDMVEHALQRAGATTTRRVEGWQAAPGAGSFVRARALIATVPGTAPAQGTRLVLSAHADAVAYSPGVGDDAVGVAAVVEAVRIASAARMRGDVTALISAHEELGVHMTPPLLDGALPELENAASAADAVVVFDSGGNALPLVVNYAPNGGMALVGAGRVPLAWSFVADTAAFMGLVQDRTELHALAHGAPAGARARPGAHLGFSGGHAWYHTPCDDFAHLGAGALAAVVHAALDAVRVADAPLPSLEQRAASTTLRLPLLRRPLTLPRLACVLVGVAGAVVAVAGLVMRARKQRPGERRVRTALKAAVAQTLAAVLVSVAAVLAFPAWPALVGHSSAHAAGVVAAVAGACLAVGAIWASDEDAPFVLLLLLGALAGSAAIPGVATLAFALGILAASTVQRHARAFVGPMLVIVMATQGFVVIADNSGALWDVGVGLLALLALLVVAALPPLPRALRLVGGLGALGAGAFALAYASLAKVEADDACPSALLDVFVDADLGTSMLVTRDAEGVHADVDAVLAGGGGDARVKPGTAVRLDALERMRPGNDEQYRVRDIEHLSLPAPSAALVGVKDVDGQRCWHVHFAQGHAGRGQLRVADEVTNWLSIGVVGAPAQAVRGDVVMREHPAAFTGVGPDGVDAVICTGLDRHELRLRLTELQPVDLPIARASGPPHTQLPSPIARIVKRVTLTEPPLAPAPR